MSDAWRFESRFVTIASPWVRLLGERWRDNQGRLLDYWRVEKEDSVIVLPRQARGERGRILLPAPQFRPGVGAATLDLPGGRVPADGAPLDAAPRILTRELGLAPEAVSAWRRLNETGWIVNSSFNNQRLFGIVADIDPTVEPPADLLYQTYPDTREGVLALLSDLECLQCVAVAHAYLAGLD